MSFTYYSSYARKGEKNKVQPTGYYSRPYTKIITSGLPFVVSASCRETHCYAFQRVLAFSPEYHTGRIKRECVDREKVENLDRVREVLDLPGKVFYEDASLIYEFPLDEFNGKPNMLLSTLLYIDKYRSFDYSVIFDKEKISSKLIFGSSSMDIMTNFSWYLAYIKEFTDFHSDYAETGRTYSGIWNYIKRKLFIKNPELKQVYIDYCNKVDLNDITFAFFQRRKV